MAELLSYEKIGEYAMENIQLKVQKNTGMSISECVRKQIPKVPNFEGDGYDMEGSMIYDTWICPCCECRFEVEFEEYKYCPNCGQKIDQSQFE